MSTEFKVGQKVVNVDGSYDFIKGETYTVTAVEEGTMDQLILLAEDPAREYVFASRFRSAESQFEIDGSDEKRALDKVRGLHGDWRIAAADAADAKEKEYNKLVELKSAAETLLAIKDISIEDINLLAEVIRA